MTENKTKPTDQPIDSFLATVSDARQQEAGVIIGIMQQITGKAPVLWGPSIIGFGSVHYKYDTGREGDMPLLGFSPRKASITVYFSEGFDRYAEQLTALGKYKQSVSCLYINKLSDVNVEVLRRMLELSAALSKQAPAKATTVEEYIASVPQAARPTFDLLRTTVCEELPHANEVFSYGIIGYKVSDARARVFISGWKDHVALYPVPRDDTLQDELAPYIKGKGTLWFSLTEPLPTELIKKIVAALTR